MPSVREYSPQTLLASGYRIPDPVFYHRALSELAVFYYWFRTALNSGSRGLVDLVHIADERLAEMIVGLPPHLQSDELKTEQTEARDAAYPWASWQKFDLALKLLFFRMQINRTLQEHRGEEFLSHELSGPRFISLDCAQMIVWINSEWQYPAVQRQQGCVGVLWQSYRY